MGTTPLSAGRPGRLPIHPHVRGDNELSRWKIKKCYDSPPRAWGQRFFLCLVQGGRRFTPTCVGTTPGLLWGRRQLPIHPHVRGDNNFIRDPEDWEVDSPPRAWGQQDDVWNGIADYRFTPTCVGTTAPTSSGKPEQPIHPHVRGDNRGVSPDARGVPDSPPRAWGQPENTVIADYRSRFTPTCVGTTRVQMPCWVHPAIHPHVRGDNRNERRIRPIHLDSPPRAWGQRFRVQRHRVRHRFTPTCVGTTSAKRQNRPAWSIHPHVRGDNSIALSLGSWVNDSPPRAWGQRSLPLRRARYLRFTPTCVGTTTPTGSATTRCTIHPHVRGDNAISEAKNV